jgi:hypothetical protein
VPHRGGLDTAGQGDQRQRVRGEVIPSLRGLHKLDRDLPFDRAAILAAMLELVGNGGTRPDPREINTASAFTGLNNLQVPSRQECTRRTGCERPLASQTRNTAMRWPNIQRWR